MQLYVSDASSIFSLGGGGMKRVSCQCIIYCYLVPSLMMANLEEDLDCAGIASMQTMLQIQFQFMIQWPGKTSDSHADVDSSMFSCSIIQERFRILSAMFIQVITLDALVWG